MPSTYLQSGSRVVLRELVRSLCRNDASDFGEMTPMNAIQAVGTTQRHQFTLNTTLDPALFTAQFREHGRVRLRNFLSPTSADALYQHLHRNACWNTFFVLDGQVMRTTADPSRAPEMDERSLQHAYEGVHLGHAYAHDATSLFPEDTQEQVVDSTDTLDPVLSDFRQFLRSQPFLELARRVIGCAELRSAHAVATRFRRGHFMSFHSAISQFDPTGKRKAVFFLNLTPEWKPERGGLMEFRSKIPDVVEAYVPCFNTLDVISFPQGYWISQVAAFAQDPMLAISGRLYVS